MQAKKVTQATGKGANPMAIQKGRVTALLLVLAAALAPGAHAQPEAEQQEFQEALIRAMSQAATIQGNKDLFLESVQPFGPLDLAVGRDLSGQQVEALRNFFLGVIGGAAGLSEEVVSDATNSFHCGPPCAKQRKEKLEARLAEISTLVAAFRELPGIDVVAVWPGDACRLGMLVLQEDAAFELVQSPELGLLPWEKNVLTEDQAKAHVAKVGLNAVEAREMATRMRELEIVAMAREGKTTVRAILRGSIGDNEAGLLFLGEKDKPPPLREYHGGGRAYVGLEKIGNGVYFYTST